eukprot:7380094-Prymnesium_polylepis.1
MRRRPARHARCSAQKAGQQRRILVRQPRQLFVRAGGRRARRARRARDRVPARQRHRLAVRGVPQACRGDREEGHYSACRTPHAHARQSRGARLLPAGEGTARALPRGARIGAGRRQGQQIEGGHVIGGGGEAVAALARAEAAGDRAGGEPQWHEGPAQLVRARLLYARRAAPRAREEPEAHHLDQGDQHAAAGGQAVRGRLLERRCECATARARDGAGRPRRTGFTHADAGGCADGRL